MHGRCPDKIFSKATEQVHMALLHINGLISPIIKMRIQSLWLFLPSSYCLKTLNISVSLQIPWSISAEWLESSWPLLVPARYRQRNKAQGSTGSCPAHTAHSWQSHRENPNLQPPLSVLLLLPHGAGRLPHPTVKAAADTSKQPSSKSFPTRERTVPKWLEAFMTQPVRWSMEK